MTRFSLRVPVLAALTALLPVGCGEKAGGSPEAVARQFVEALAARDTATAAQLFAYQALARQQNEDWDSIPHGQRKLIVAKLAEEKAKELAQWAALFSSTQYTVGAAWITGASATVDLTPPSGPGLALHLAQEDGLWRVESIG